MGGEASHPSRPSKNDMDLIEQKGGSEHNGETRHIDDIFAGIGQSYDSKKIKRAFEGTDLITVIRSMVSLSPTPRGQAGDKMGQLSTIVLGATIS